MAKSTDREISQFLKDIISDYVDDGFSAINENKLGNELIEKLELEQINIAFRNEDNTTKKYCEVVDKESKEEYSKLMYNLLNDTIDLYANKVIEASGEEGAKNFLEKLKESNSDTTMSFIIKKVLYLSFELDGNTKGKENGI